MKINPFALAGQLVAAILPDPVEAWLRGIVDQVEKLLQGETARVIGYGAGIVIYLVAKAVQAIPDMPFDQAVLQAGAAATMVISIVEAIRHYVFSPATVAAIVATPPTAAGPIVAAAAAGVAPEVVAEAIAEAEAGEGPVDGSAKGEPLPDTIDADEAEPDDELPEPEA